MTIMKKEYRDDLDTLFFGTVFYTNANLHFTPIRTPITENKTNQDGVR